VRTQPFERIVAELGQSDYIPAAFLFAQMIERDVDGDAAEPVLKRRAAVELRERAPDLEERLLREVLEPVMVALVAVKNGEDMRLMAADKFGELVVRAVSDSLQQFGIVVHSFDRASAD